MSINVSLRGEVLRKIFSLCKFTSQPGNAKKVFLDRNGHRSQDLVEMIEFDNQQKRLHTFSHFQEQILAMQVS